MHNHRWPEEEPERPELRQQISDGFPVRTFGDRMFAIGLRIAGRTALYLGAGFVILLMLYALNNILF